ncbi:alpha/beta fold hydrolase [Telmatobacter sp. DSM 110680]|uniref:Alpha/beta fold hydrolase n=1 Tax=Telmatobacter sp. DSM 110680 TaxID=3036704 RepID=A0AAU7DG59_9BACT
MLRCWTIMLCAILLTFPASAKSRITKLTFDFSEHARVMYVVVPEKPEAMPVVVLLHGSGRNGEIMAQAWKDLAGQEGFIVAAPDAFDPASWGSLMDPPEFFSAVVEQVKAIHAVDESRIYLFGHSAGAAYALFLAVMDSDLFAATAVHAGALQANPDGLFEQADRKMPIAIWVGDHDPNFPVDTVEATRRLYAANGYEIKLNLIPNHDHNYYAISDQVNGKAWDFLKGVRLKSASNAGQP